MEKIKREKIVIGQMINIYCRAKHKRFKKREGTNLCDECIKLLEYSHNRLTYCPKGNHKTSCKKCAIHCYSPEMKDKIRILMRYVGPRMIFHHPISAIRHIICK